MAALAIAVWLAPDPVLRWTAEAWIVSDRVVPPDAVAVVGGGIDDRPSAAASDYRRGLVKKVLVSDTDPGPAGALGDGAV